MDARERTRTASERCREAMVAYREGRIGIREAESARAEFRAARTLWPVAVRVEKPVRIAGLDFVDQDGMLVGTLDAITTAEQLRELLDAAEARNRDLTIEGGIDAPFVVLRVPQPVLSTVTG